MSTRHFQMYSSRSRDRLMEVGDAMDGEFFRTEERPTTTRPGGLKSPKGKIRSTSRSSMRKRSRTNLYFASRDLDPLLLTRLKPKFNGSRYVEKEQLYEKNLAVQLEFNNVQAENQRLKVQINRLVKQLEQKDERRSSSSTNILRKSGSHLVGNLKQVICDLKAVNKNYEEENRQFKRTMKVTRVSELETELQAYIDEWMRLRRFLEQQAIMIQTTPDSDQAVLISTLQSDLASSRSTVKQLTEENSQLRSALNQRRKQSGVPPSTQSRRPNRITVRAGQSEEKAMIQNLQGEIKTLKEQLGQQSSPSPPPKISSELSPPKQTTPDELMRGIQGYIESKELRPDVFFGLLDKHGSGHITIQELYEELQGMHLVESKQTIEALGTRLDSSQVIEITDLQSYFEELYPAPEPPKPTDEVPTLKKAGREDVESMLRHIALRMQLHRLSKAKLATTLFGQDFDRDGQVNVLELATIFSWDPFNFKNPEERRTLARFLLEPQNRNFFITEMEIEKLSAMRKEVAGKLFMELDDWVPFKPEEEAEFDQYIGSLISKNRLSFKEAWRDIDEKKTGFIMLEEFLDVLETLDLIFDENHLKYMILLFYSHSMELNRVPYLKFVEAYGVLSPSEFASPNESTEIASLTEQEREKVMRDCLQVISDGLLSSGKTIDEVFETKDGLLFPEEFLRGLSDIKVPELEKKTLLVFMETLQWEEEDDELCINLNELRALVQNFKENTPDLTEIQGENIESPMTELQQDISVLDPEESIVEEQIQSSLMQEEYEDADEHSSLAE